MALGLQPNSKNKLMKMASILLEKENLSRSCKCVRA